jgi:hypothetical protein
MGANMISRTFLKTLGVGLLAAGLLSTAPFAAAQSAPAVTATAKSLDYEFFKARVEPIFLKKRPGHARCYVCHSGRGEGGAPAYLEKLSPGATTWDDEQSQRIFQRVSHYVVPGNPAESPLVMHPLAPEAGGDYSNRMHGGGRQFASQDDPDWKNLAAWVRGQKQTSSSTQ